MGAFREWMFHEKNREWLDVMVWSSAQPHSVDDMVQKAFGEDGKELLKAVWARDKMGLGADAYCESIECTLVLPMPAVWHIPGLSKLSMRLCVLLVELAIRFISSRIYLQVIPQVQLLLVCYMCI